MKKAITYGVLIIFALTIVFHVLVICKVVPYGIIWGGRINNDTSMYRFEAISIALNVLFFAVVAIFAGILKLPVPQKVIRAIMFAMSALFLLNTVGNLLSKNSVEKAIFTPITILLTVALIVLLKTKTIHKGNTNK